MTVSTQEATTSARALSKQLANQAAANTKRIETELKPVVSASKVL
jgi:hypothetical protein